jgi:hypothetical protein
LVGLVKFENNIELLKFQKVWNIFIFIVLLLAIYFSLSFVASRYRADDFSSAIQAQEEIKRNIPLKTNTFYPNKSQYLSKAVFAVNTNIWVPVHLEWLSF